MKNEVSNNKIPSELEAVVARAVAILEESNHVFAPELLTVIESKHEVFDAAALLETALNTQKQQLVQFGRVTQRIGWQVDGLVLLLPVNSRCEKYRFYREVSAVGKKLQAEAIYLLCDNYLRNERGERTGQEMLMVSIINPDGSAWSATAIYTRRSHPQLDHDIIEFQGESESGECHQWLIPAWGTYIPN